MPSVQPAIGSEGPSLPSSARPAGANNTVHRDTNLTGQPIRVGSIDCRKGVWTHAFDDATPADVEIDLGVMPAVTVLTCGLPMVEVGIYLRKLPQGINEARDQLSCGQGGLKHHRGAKPSFTVQ